MSDEPVSSIEQQVVAMRREREQLVQQIQESQETITRSLEMIERLDAILTKADSIKP